ncbi:HupE/UreJ family protein [Neiella marina]|uniref:HupE/UreJ family protein n=1 Tax=Neiella holothuriorum TaxID=2870530 RepID=A0ABS7EKI6_9GAMM|nr:HupE/UreJ family protein [Neiella holothuriorum]MBW8192841.1 HupE/UreJ family protein [Neiella holothuriorum]
MAAQTNTMTLPLMRPVFRPLFFLNWLRLPLLLLCLLPSLANAHPQDEDIILDIELGEMQLQEGQIDQEYQAALKRKRLRKLASMSPLETFQLYVTAGFEHIIPKGLDHILFVLGLFFSSLLLASLLWQITAFTLAHSITLGLASLGIVAASGSIVEPLIALSIVWIAIENCLFKQTSKWRPAVVFSFGLLHGLGFAAVLNDYGLPKDDLVPALLAFNIGVEFGQISVILLAFLATYLIRKKAWYRHWIQIPASAVIGLVGLFWFVERVFL